MSDRERILQEERLIKSMKNKLLALPEEYKYERLRVGYRPEQDGWKVRIVYALDNPQRAKEVKRVYASDDPRINLEVTVVYTSDTPPRDAVTVVDWTKWHPAVIYALYALDAKVDEMCADVESVKLKRLAESLHPKDVRHPKGDDLEIFVTAKTYWSAELVRRGEPPEVIARGRESDSHFWAIRDLGVTMSKGPERKKPEKQLETEQAADVSKHRADAGGRNYPTKEGNERGRRHKLYEPRSSHGRRRRREWRRKG
ncbi:hypothetical protein BU26DRAFT_603969 [Trematosphaeria pertusa]|uniref:Uncharacterized protein n=1 Tax=Trematosphaeria pertusa TaxID=390896 RepID=A0A6A6ILT0_9PLEO|nr:uncharacterized protein BU26DRAFT_603969 [Trematosphaeria pertusa]KAF2251575.1 hypothetical protein BU26DRAFT_603969 [Trematosphaeria pertusa]